MGLLQGLIVFLRKSSRKLLQAVFGWAVAALFGTPKESEKTLLSVVVGCAAAWPLLLVGVAFPKTAALVLAFVPIPSWVPEEAVRGGWIAAAVLVPLGVGLVLAKRGRVDLGGESFWKRALRGVPVTVAIGAAFVVAFLTSPIRRLIAVSRRWEDEHLPLILEPDDYVRVADHLRRTLGRAGLEMERAKPPWLLTAPSRVIGALGGRILRDRLPKNLQFFRGRELEVVVNPNGVTIQGEPERAARAHGILSEEVTLTPGLQTTDATAQEIEKRLKDVWRVFREDPERHRDSRALLGVIHQIARDLDETFIDYENWQVLYREILQIERAIQGDSQLLEETEETDMESWRSNEPVERPLRGLSSADLVAGTVRELGELVRQEVELAKAEIRRDLKEEVAMARSFGIAALAAILFLNMLFVAAALALSRWMAPWLAALVVAAALLIVAVGFGWAGWNKRVKPLESTRKTLKESWLWAKSRAA